MHGIVFILLGPEHTPAASLSCVSCGVALLVVAKGIAIVAGAFSSWCFFLPFIVCFFFCAYTVCQSMREGLRTWFTRPTWPAVCACICRLDDSTVASVITASVVIHAITIAILQKARRAPVGAPSDRFFATSTHRRGGCPGCSCRRGSGARARR